MKNRYVMYKVQTIYYWIKAVFRYWPLSLIAISLPILGFLSNYSIGQPKIINAQVISLGANQSAIGSSVYLVCKTEHGNTIRINTVAGITINVGDSVKLMVHDRILFVDRYSLQI